MLKKITTTTATTAILSNAWAIKGKLPEMDAPSRQGKGIIETIQNYAYDFIIFGGLVLAAVAFLFTAMKVFGIFLEVQNGKKTWGEFGTAAMVGILMLVFIVFLATKAGEIL